MNIRKSKAFPIFRSESGKQELTFYLNWSKAEIMYTLI